MMARLRAEKVHTWFDLGLFLDRVKEKRYTEKVPFKGSFDLFKNKLGKGGVAFITFHYTVDGVTVEIQKYAQAFKSILGNVPVHYIAGNIRPEAGVFIDQDVKKHEILLPDFCLKSLQSCQNRF